MNSSGDSRPYYDHDTFNAGYSVIYKPGVGLIDPSQGKRLTATLFEGSGPGKGIGIRGASTASISSNVAGNSTGNAAASGVTGKNYVYDLEFQEYFDMSNLTELTKNLVWSFVRNYSKVLMSQPLEIVRLVLQVGQIHSRESKKASASTIAESDDSDSEYEINYFQTPGEASDFSGAGHGLSGLGTDSIRSESALSESQKWAGSTSISESQKLTKSVRRNNKRPSKKIEPTTTHTLDVLSSLVSAEGPVALFRGVNATFIYQTLSHTIEAWITGLVSPFLGIPDPFFLDLTHSPDPWRSLLLSVGACVATGLVLIPLDIIRIKLMITQFGSKSTRSVRESLRHYPSIAPPASVVVLTTLHQLSASVFRRTAPYVLFIRYNMDVYNAPGIYTVVNLGSLLLEFFFKLPVENVLRKEQLRWLLSEKDDARRVVTIGEEELIVNTAEPEHNSSEVYSTVGGAKVAIGNLYNGWRVGLLNLLAVWGYAVLKTNTTDPERL